MNQIKILVAFCLISYAATPWASTPSLQISTHPILAEFSIEPRPYRLGLATLFSNEFLMYVGEKIYFFHLSTFHSGITGGIQTGLSAEGSKFLFDTEDGYFGLISEWAVDPIWGIGLEINHHSAHVGDGRFRTLTPPTFNQNFLTLRAVAQLTPQVATQLKLHIFGVDAPQNRTTESEISLMVHPWNFLNIEGLASFDNIPNQAHVLRLKISACLPPQDNVITHSPTFVPYILLHHGKHIFGQRYGENVSLVALAGVEFNL